VLAPPGRGVGRNGHAPPGFIYRAVGRRLAIYTAPEDGVVEPGGDVWVDGVIGGIDRADDRLFVAAGRAGLRVYDVSDPAAPRAIGHHPTNAAAAVRVSDGLAYLVDRIGGLRILDITDPAAIIEVGAFAPGPVFWRVAVDPDRRRVAIANRNEVVLVDVRDPARPAEAGRLQPHIIAEMRFVPETPLLYISASITDELYDVSTPDAPIRWQLPRGGVMEPAGSESIYTIDWRHLSLLDISDPSAAVVRREWDLPGSVVDFTFMESTPPRVVLNGVGIEVHALEDGSLDRPIALFIDEGMVDDLAYDGGRIYVADGRGGLRIVDVGDPRSPTEVAIRLPRQLSDRVGDVAFDGGRLALFEHNVGVKVYAAGDDDTWRLIDHLLLENWVHAMTFEGERLWTVHAGVLKLFEPDAGGLRLAAELNAARAGDITPLDRAGWVAIAVPGGVRIARFDLEDELSVVAELPLRARVRRLARVGDRLYVAGDFGGVLALDVSDPSAPVEVDRWVPGDPVIDIAVHADRVVALTDQGQVWASEIGPNPVFGTATPVPTRCAHRRLALDPDGRTLYLGGWTCLVETVRLDCLLPSD